MVLDGELIAAIHRSERRLVCCLAGGGVSGLAALLATPGASRSVLEGVVPYSAAALAQWLGAAPDQACSEATAQAMAMAAWRRAGLLEPAADPQKLAGVSCTASLATDRPKRGDHRMHVGVQTVERTVALSLHFNKEARTRGEEEQLAAGVFLVAVGIACGCDVAGQREQIEMHLLDNESIARREHVAPTAWQRVLLAGDVVVEAGEAAGFGKTKPPVVFPGAFNPPHAGHLKMAELSEALSGQEAAWEISIVNVDKPPLDWLSVAQRVAGLRAVDPRRAIILSPDATFDRKAARWPGATFVVGVDTLTRIADCRYYEDDTQQRDLALEEIARQRCRFLVFGRLVGDQFCRLEDVELPEALRRLCQGVEQDVFRVDMSSTALRAAE